MKVSELAKELKTSDSVILAKLKGLHLRAKDGEQELSKAVITVLRSEIVKEMKASFGAGERAALKAKEEAKALRAAKEAALKAKEEEALIAKKKGKGEKPGAKKAATAEEAVVEKPVEIVVEKVVEAVPENIPLKAAEKPLEKKAVVTAKPTDKIEAAPAPVAMVKPVDKPAPVKVEHKEEPFTAVKPLLKKKKRGDGHGGPMTVDHDRAGLFSPTAGAKPAAVPVAAPRDTSGFPTIEVNIPISVKDFAVAIDQKPSMVLQKLIRMGILATINQNLGEDVLRKLANEFNYNIAKLKTSEEKLVEEHKAEQEDPKLLKSRAPVVTFMGHVDHGKTSLLDRIRKSQVADSEHGGITQHIGAYSVETPKGRITFLDTPGHEAFTAMRARGAHITDLVILVVAADEGVMPQTEEAINHARAANVPIIVALNKIDRKDADADRVKKQLMELGLNSEDWGGKTIVVPVSAVTGEGIPALLDMMLLEAEMLELKANPNKKASGIVVEAHLSRGKGSVACMIVQSGTLKLNDIVVVGPYHGKVKAIFDDHERTLQEAGPSMPVEILGLPAVPEAGEEFYVVDDERRAKEISEARKEHLKTEKLLSSHRITLEDIYSQIQQGKIKELNVILKADVQGSLEALKDSLEKIPSREVKVKCIHTGVGDVSASDVILAVASNAIILAFHVDISPKAKDELEKNPVDVREYRIIYDAVNDMRKALEGMLEPRTKRIFVSRIEVRQVFKLSKAGTIAGCFVLKGKVLRKAQIDVIRNDKVIHSSTISSLKRFKDDVREVPEGYECGISINGFDTFEPNDILETFTTETITRTLASSV